MKCNSCETRIHFHPTVIHGPVELSQIQRNPLRFFQNKVQLPGKKSWREGLKVGVGLCPNCYTMIIAYLQGRIADDGAWADQPAYKWTSIFPEYRAPARPVPDEVPDKHRELYGEATATLEISPRASAALSRRLLQDLLRDAGYEQHNLSAAIKAFITDRGTPSFLAEAVDHVREVGNYGAHELKEVQSGTVLNVEPGEAEYNLDVLDTLFDHLFVQPERLRRNKEAVNRKLKSAGRRPLQEPEPGSTES